MVLGPVGVNGLDAQFHVLHKGNKQGSVNVTTPLLLMGVTTVLG